MKAEKIPYPYNKHVEFRIIQESDFQKLVTLMKELREKDKVDVLNKCVRSLNSEQARIINSFLDANKIS